MQSFRKDQLASQIQIPGMWVSLGCARAQTKNYTTSVSSNLAVVRTDVRVICLFTMSKISPLAVKPRTGTECFIKRT